MGDVFVLGAWGCFKSVTEREGREKERAISFLGIVLPAPFIRRNSSRTGQTVLMIRYKKQ